MDLYSICVNRMGGTILFSTHDILLSYAPLLLRNIYYGRLSARVIVAELDVSCESKLNFDF